MFRVPRSVLNKLESLRSQFFNGSEVGSKKAIWVKWNDVLKDKARGGLGVVSLYALNRGLLVKWYWKFFNQNSSLLAKVIKAIYGEDGGVDSMKISNGDTVSFWKDNWQGEGALKKLFPRGGTKSAQYNGLVDLVSTININPSEDRWNWSLESSGDFTVASIRRVIDEKRILMADLISSSWISRCSNAFMEDAIILLNNENPIVRAEGLRARRKLKPGALSLYVGNGQREAIEAIDAFYLCLPSGLEIVLNNCHYAPSITRGVISVSCLYEDGFVNRFVDNTIQHCRLGHISKKRIEKLQHDGLLESSVLRAFEKCVSCMSGKMAWEPYTHQVKRAKDLLRLIHTDVYGPFNIMSRQGASYFVTFTDDFHCYGYVYVLKHKHEVFETFKVFQKEVENQLRSWDYRPSYSSLHSTTQWSTRTRRAPDRMCLYINTEEHELGDLGESANYKAALLDHKSEKWLNAMNVEMQSMKDNEGWVLVELSPNGKTVGSKWLFKKKTDMDGNVHIYKARLVAKGYTQTPGIDYEETFSPVADIKAIRILIAIATYYDYEIWQMDVKTTFLNGYLNEEEKLKLSKSQGTSTPAEMKRMQNVPYASAVGSIMYVVRCTRPDVVFAQNITSRFQQNPGDIHWTTVKNILKYFRNTKDMFLVYEGDLKRELRVSCYTDAGYLTDANDLKSQTGYVFILNGGAVDWKSAKQSIFATSSAEVEYIAAFDAFKEAVWVRKFISGLGVVLTIKEPISMYCDYTGAIAIANESGITKGARHFRAKVHYLREVIEFGDIKLEKVHIYDNLANHFTKASAFLKHSEHTRNIGMLPASSLM
nr:hypothetical protein [Tanacetum cinerariifolium]